MRSIFTWTARSLALALLAAGLVCRAPAYQSDASSISRTLDRTVALTNTPVLATVWFTNGGAAALRGWCFSEQLPSALSASLVSVTVGGTTVTNAQTETGWDGDVLAGCTPWRCMLELPADFNPANPVAAQAVVKVVYSITSSTAGSYTLPQFMWFGADLVQTNASFGYSESTDQKSIRFFTSDTPPVVTSSAVTNGVLVTLTGATGSTYVLESSLNLASWTPLATNTAPFSYTNTNLSIGGRYYRGRWAP
ncbi:MAG: hypothetical protein U1F98_13165 [Verrucomicrobiota bacterium]